MGLLPKVKFSYRPALFVLFGFLIGILLGWLIFSGNNKIISDSKFTNPRAQVSYSKNKKPQEKTELQEKLNKTIYKIIDDKGVDSISVYFRAFEQGDWVGVNEDLRYAPASMFKVPLAIAYYKFAQVQPEILSKNLVFNERVDFNKRKAIDSLAPSLEKNKSYTVKNLIERMLIYSDNNALDILESNLDKTFFKEVDTDLGLPFPYKAGDQDFISPKSFSIIYRMLYNNSYLKREFSEEILKMLSQSEFNKGLKAKLPSEIVVAHKFGEKTFNENNPNESREFHDCGIVYHDTGPYSIRIMTIGKNLDTLESVVADISELVDKNR